MKLLVTTACLYPSVSYVDRLAQSCHKFGYNFVPYGMDQPYKHWRQAKIDLLIPFLQQREEDFVLFSDGGDTWAVAPEEETIHKIRSFKSPLIVSAEINSYPSDYSKYRIFDWFRTPFRFACAGQFVGERKYLIDCLEKISEVDLAEGNDQHLWNVGLGEGIIKGTLDHYCKIFQAVQNDDHFLFKNNRVFNKITKSKPCFIHYGGPKYDTSRMDEAWEETKNG